MRLYNTPPHSCKGRFVPGSHTKPTQETLCGSCNKFVGVNATPFNKSPQMVMPKTVSHRRDGKTCPGSRVSVHPNNIMPVI
jgi:hypothetical protein